MPISFSWAKKVGAGLPLSAWYNASMRFITDLHIHSRYSRATSRGMSPETLWRWGQLKGVAVLGTGDFTHPLWHKELMEKLESAGNGMYRLKKVFAAHGIPASCQADIFFMPSAEISCIYKKNDRTRKVHVLLLARSLDDAYRINIELAKIGNLSSDGRPILGLDAKELLRIVLETSADALFVPAHIWTPHFSVFGSESGFDSLEECFDELTPHIHTVETGLSSDPPMNWRIAELDRLTLISNSDCHSASKIGREATVFDTELSYDAIMHAIKTRQGYAGTIEFFPEEGKYHADGHRACSVCLSPQETIRHNYLCPVCGKAVTVGVLHRVEKLAVRDEGFSPKKAAPFRSLIPLQELIAEALNAGAATKKVQAAYFDLLEKCGNELSVLTDVPMKAIRSAVTEPKIAEAIDLMRKGHVHSAPGYDGEYGKVRIFEKVASPEKKGQEVLF
ncbi:MAG TPA: endonuclease Q family protein [Dissulfurispiraceae bacterium]|nr:endonuclease Q family protein [Dissulfurispiraceae bacterium]